MRVDDDDLEDSRGAVMAAWRNTQTTSPWPPMLLHLATRLDMDSCRNRPSRTGRELIATRGLQAFSTI